MRSQCYTIQDGKNVFRWDGHIQTFVAFENFLLFLNTIGWSYLSRFGPHFWRSLQHVALLVPTDPWGQSSSPLEDQTLSKGASGHVAGMTLKANVHGQLLPPKWYLALTWFWRCWARQKLTVSTWASNCRSSGWHAQCLLPLSHSCPSLLRVT